MSDQTNAAIILVQSKSMAVGILLALFFGPLGLFYSSVPGALIMIVVAILLGLVTLGIGLLLIPLLCVIWAAVAINAHNAKLAQQRAS